MTRSAVNERGANLTCPDDEALSRFVRSDGVETSDLLAEHVSGCELCRSVLAKLADREPSPTPREEIVEGSRIGRYIVETRLGSGGMGIVYRARDAELGRSVALKLLRDRSSSEDARRRMLHEAKAMAALQHPNVVTLYDFGEHAGSVYLAMEMMRETARQWLATERDVKDIVEIYVGAASGLAAAHALGIVHRDFKPDNVFIGNDGRARVGDFGLARSQPEPVSPSMNADVLATTVSGTLPYMAPEQLAGKRADTRSDQFSFCVALCEALCGKLPFAGASLTELQASHIEPVAMPPSVPRYVAGVLERGLSIDPAKRFESIAELIEQLTIVPARRRRRAIATIAGIALVGSVGVAYVVGREPSTSPAQCDGGRAVLGAVWNPTVEARLRGRFAASPLPYMPELGTHVLARVRDYTDAWATMHHDACAATIEQGTQSPELMDLRMSCLSDRLRETHALVDELEIASDKELNRAMDATGRLGTLAACADEKALRRNVAPPPPLEILASVEAVRSELLAAKFAEATSAYDRSLELATTALETATTSGYEPIQAEAMFGLALALARLERGPEATDRLHQAAALADASRVDRIAAAARVQLVSTLGMREGKLDESNRMVEYASASIRRMGGSPELEAELLLNRAAILNQIEKPDEALPLSLKALTILEKLPSPDWIRVARTYNTIGNETSRASRYLESLPYFDNALALFEKNLGSDHPLVANVLTNRGGSLRYLGRFDEALDFQQRALAIRERVFGADHPEVAAALTNIANTYNAKGDRDKAYELRKRALAIAEAKLPPTHNNLVIMRLNLLESMMQTNATNESIAFCDRWLPIEQRDRADRPSTARMLTTCAISYLRADQPQRAWAAHRAAMTLVDKIKDTQTEDWLQSFAEEVHHRGQVAEALPLLERALRHSRDVNGANSPETTKLQKLVDEARVKR